MEAERIFAPVLALVGWTLLVLLTIPFYRFKAGFAGKITPRDFTYGESARVPDQTRIPNRHYMNLLEAPLLFYVVCVIMVLTQRVDDTAVMLAWVYFGLRMLHSLIHMTYNHVLHRLGVFATSTLVLGVIWARLVLQLAT